MIHKIVCTAIIKCSIFFLGINAEGIYRIPGNKQQVEILQQRLTEGKIMLC